MSNYKEQEEFNILSVDAEIHLATYPFELNYSGTRLVGTMEQRGDGTYKFHWNSRIPTALNSTDLSPLISAILNEYEKQVRKNLRDDITEEIIRKISD